ncbi:MAG: RHS repeat-associated core domain-containing protein [Archangium sp.]|nr:RHS repeat-associated core domain-containing protein [Archangium sp.]
MRCSFKTVAVFTVLCLTPSSYARYYDPEYGRFLSLDEMEGKLDNAPSLHRFVYAHNNPLRYTDPKGHEPFELPDPWVQFETIWHQGGEAVAESPPVLIATGTTDVIGEVVEAQKRQTLGEFGIGTPEEVAAAKEVQNERVKEAQIWGPPGSPGASVKGTVESFLRAGKNLGEGVAACSSASYYECGRTLPFGILEGGMLVHGGASLARPEATAKNSSREAVVVEGGTPRTPGPAPENTFLTYEFYNASKEPVYVGRASGPGTPQQVMKGRLAKGHDVFDTNPGLTPKINAVQGNKLASQGAEGVLYEQRLREGAKLLNDPKSPPLSSKPSKAADVRAKIDAYAEDLKKP